MYLTVVTFSQAACARHGDVMESELSEAKRATTHFKTQAQLFRNKRIDGETLKAESHNHLITERR